MYSKKVKNNNYFVLVNCPLHSGESGLYWKLQVLVLNNYLLVQIAFFLTWVVPLILNSWLSNNNLVFVSVTISFNLSNTWFIGLTVRINYNNILQ